MPDPPADRVLLADPADAAGRTGAHRRRPARPLALVCALLFAVCSAVAVSVRLADVPAFAQVRAHAHRSEAVLLDRAGVPLQRLRIDQHVRALDWVALADVSPALVRAVIAAEDRRFEHHAGVDFEAIGSAVLDNLGRRRPRGASTITMQLAQLLRDRDAPDSARHGVRSAADKLRQMRDALALERTWTKAQILEAYLDLVPFRGELVGVEAASRGLFGKWPDGLDHLESALLAALLRSPGATPALLGARTCSVLEAVGQGELCPHARQLALALPRRPLLIGGRDEAPHLARRLLARAGESVRTTLDADLQRFAMEALRGRIAELRGRNVEDGAVVVIENATGDVLAYIGSSGDLSGAPEVDGVVALRQPGSTLKPFLYGLALDRGWLDAASILDDSPIALDTPSGQYIPQNYERHFVGPVSLRTALASSLNVPAVRTLTLEGVDRFLSTLHDFGLASLDRDADHYGFGLALGDGEVSLLELTNAYRALALGGMFRPVRLRPDETTVQGHRAIGAEAAFILADILSDPAARVPTFGRTSVLATTSWSAVKTGTSKGMRDNWAIGFTDRYTVGVWMGNFSGASMWDVSGVTGPAPLWRDIIEHLHARVPSRAPLPPPGVVARPVTFQPAVEPPRTEWFCRAFAGTDAQVGANAPPRVVAWRGASSRPRIVSPAGDEVVAPDPDIPEARQAIFVRAEGQPSAKLLLDGRPIAKGGLHTMLALPGPGRHALTLVDDAGRELDRRSILVRALPSSPSQRVPSR